MECPSCRHPTQLSERGVAALPTAFHINNLLEIDQLLKKTHTADNEDGCFQDEHEEIQQSPLCHTHDKQRHMWGAHLFQVQHWV